ncbi:hypothetical protein LCGC14_1918920 [marine sediment metagenome]|uniref:Uncharacterized protein n=1 Tax=marine sediment metagenome TaxID=412755 RepID=A0A0F9FS63_9ZZZZ
MKMPAAWICEGDLIDLAGDPYADPDDEHANWFESEYLKVVQIIRETPKCVAIGFEGFDLVGFPVDHILNVAGRERP